MPIKLSPRLKRCLVCAAIERDGTIKYRRSSDNRTGQDNATLSLDGIRRRDAGCHWTGQVCLFLSGVYAPVIRPVKTGFDFIADKIKDPASEHSPLSTKSVAASITATGRLLGSSFQESSAGRAKVAAAANSQLTGGRSEICDNSTKRRRTGLVTPV